MVTLTLLNPTQPAPLPSASLQQWQFEQESLIRIGRAPDNQVILPDTAVSRYHLELHKTRNFQTNTDVWRMVNRGTNGTFLNGILTTQAVVADGSLLQLAQGGPILKFQLEAAVPPTLPPTAAEPDGGAGVQCRHLNNAPGTLFCIHCGQPIAVQRVIRQYQVLRVLGQGGMGTTYLAWTGKVSSVRSPERGSMAPLPSLVVLKEMNADMAQVAKAQELFEREARTLQALNHPGIPRFFDFFVEQGKKYLVMELIHGQDLEKRVFQKGVVPPSQAIAWMVQTCDVLNYIHSQVPPIIHRDIKPGNLLVRTRDSQIVVLDFGAVKEAGTQAGTRIGVEGYTPLEQNQGYPVTQSDLYAIGPTLVFLLTGENPANFYKRKGQSYRFDLTRVPTISPQLRGVIERVTELKPSDRYPTANDLAQALKRCL